MRFIKRTTRKSIASKSLDMDAAKKLLDISAEKNRNLLIVFMAYLATATVLALSITDLDLLLDQKNIQIPLLSVGLPMWAFYTVIPFLLVLLHFNVLQNTQEHNKKREAWLAHKPIDPGTQLFPYLLDFAKVRYGLDATPNVASKLVAAGTWVIYVYLPLLVLAVFFIRFADLQGIATSSWHLALGAIDIYLLFNFWRRLRGVEQPPVSAIRWLSHFSLTLLGFAVLWTLALFSYIQLLHFKSYYSFDGIGIDLQEHDYSHSQDPINNAIALEEQLQQQIGSIAIVPRISAPDAHPYQVKDDHIRLDKWLNPDKKDGELWQSSPRPLDWSSKRLAFADLRNSQLRRVNLFRADLQGANLREAQLQGAVLHYAQLQGADLWDVQLQGANLTRAQLQGATLNSAQLQGASLFLAQLQGADLTKAQLQGADLSGAEVLGVDWESSETEGMLALDLDNSTRFDSASYVVEFPINNHFEYSMSRAAGRQEKPPSVPVPLGTQDPAVYQKTWLSLLCQNHDSHEEMLEHYYFFEQEKKHLMPKQAIRDYVDQTPRCEAYRATIDEALFR